VRLLVVAVAAVVIAYASLRPLSGGLGGAGGSGAGIVGLVGDKQLHFLGYTVFTLVLAYATAHWRDRPLPRVALVVLVALGWGLLMELLQIPVETRQFSLLDLAANTAGTLLASLWFRLERRVEYGRRSAPSESPNN
jgi:VanZ family protein